MFKLLTIYFLLVLNFPLSSTIYNNKMMMLALGNPECMLPMDRGHECTDSDNKTAPSSLSFYFDPHAKYCLAFNYKGCGGNLNRYSTFHQCMRCIPVDMIYCYGEQKGTCSAGLFDRLYCWITGGKCLNGFAGYRICCDKSAQDLFVANIAPNCSLYNKNCKGIYKINDGFDNSIWSTTLVGKKCADDFCPINTTCKQLDFFAHCFY